MRRATTTKKALKITAEHHRWLADNPTAHPSEWPGWYKYGYDLSVASRDKNPLCEVAAGKCMDCPLIALWIKGSGDLPTEQRLKSCLVSTSPFMVRTNLRHSIKEEEKEAALRASTAIYLEAEYALENGVREPDLSIVGFYRKNKKRYDAKRYHNRGTIARVKRAKRYTPSSRK